LKANARDLEAIYRTHAGMVFRRARTLLGNDAEAHEVVQDLFLSLFERPEQFAGRSTVTTWLYSATSHACLNRLRNQRNRSRLLSERAEPVELDAAPKPDAMAELRELLRRLPPPLGEVAVYAYCDELSHEEIAELVGCSRRQVGNLVDRIHRWVRSEEAACLAN
jgi:RNA polymerase sigma-70 factor (ECF subfamily)